MPRHSLKHRVLKHLMDLQSKRHLEAVMREALLGDSSSEDSVSSFELDDVRFLEDVNELVLNDVISDISKRRYLFRPINYRNRRTTFDWKDCLDDNSVRFSEVEFLAHFRMSCSAFWVIHDLIKYHEVFYRKITAGSNILLSCNFWCSLRDWEVKVWKVITLKWLHFSGLEKGQSTIM